MSLVATSANARWREPDPVEQVRTARELKRIPRRAASRMTRLDASESVQADIVLWNALRPLDLSRLLEDLRPGGWLAIQSREEPMSFEQGHRHLHMLGSMALYHGDYVFPSAGITRNAAMTSPLFFHVWQSKTG
jgi:hypothetical protein